MKAIVALLLVLSLIDGMAGAQEPGSREDGWEAQPIQETAPAAPTMAVPAALPRWALGFTASNLEFKSWPGTVSLQRRLGEGNYLSLGISGQHQQWGPDEDTDTWPVGTETDTIYSRSRSRGWNFTAAPEFSRAVRRGRNWLLLLGVEASLGVARSSYTGETRHTGSYYQYYSHTSESASYALGLNIPASLERRFTVRGQTLAVGVRGYLVKAETQRWVEERWTVSDSEYSGYSTDYDRDESRMPWNIVYKNPFQGGMQVQVKYWF